MDFFVRQETVNFLYQFTCNTRTKNLNVFVVLSFKTSGRDEISPRGSSPPRLQRLIVN